MRTLISRSCRRLLGFTKLRPLRLVLPASTASGHTSRRSRMNKIPVTTTPPQFPTISSGLPSYTFPDSDPSRAYTFKPDSYGQTSIVDGISNLNPTIIRQSAPAFLHAEKGTFYSWIQSADFCSVKLRNFAVLLDSMICCRHKYALVDECIHRSMCGECMF